MGTDRGPGAEDQDGATGARGHPTTAIRRFAEFVTAPEIPAIARAAARDAFQDAIGVMLAGATEPAARLVQRVTRTESADGPSSILATPQRAGASWAALANGTAAHALDFDDMCW